MNNLIAASALVVLTAGYAGHASAATAKVCLDNSPNGGTISGTATDDTISVYVTFWSSNVLLVGSMDPPGVSGCHAYTWDEATYEPADEVEFLTVTTNGEDWFWLDQVELFQGAMEIWSSGADNLQGWCLSEDPTDGNATNCEPDASNWRHDWLVFPGP